MNGEKLEGMRILIVDDQPLSVKLLETLLSSKGFVCSCVNNGPAALAHLEKITPDLVLLDVMMPGMSGFEVAESMRADPRFVDIPIIFVTARDDAETINQCFTSGGNDYASKPIRIYEVLARVRLQLSAYLNLRRAKASESALRQNKQFLKAVIDESPAHVFVLDSEGVWLLASKSFAKFFRSSPEDLLGRHWSHLVDQNRAAYSQMEQMIAPNAQIIASNQPQLSIEERIVTLEGDEFWFLTSRIPLTFEGLHCVLCISLDISQMKVMQAEKNRLQDQLAQSQKTELIGTLAGGIAHDFNNMLAVILGYSDLARSTLPKDAKQIKHLEEVIRAGNRAKDLVKQILNFSRQTEQQHIDVSLSVLLKEAARMLKSTQPSNISTQLDVHPDLSFIRGDQTQIHQVLMNLCVNANHAMPDGGVLKISAHDLPGASNSCCTCGQQLTGRTVHLAISDTGTGMSEAVKRRIFEPYFTTKEVGKGTGLGLAVVLGIITQHRGHICVDSELGRGTTFHIYLPASNSEVRQEKTNANLDPVVTQESARILVVDDEPMVSEITAETLSLRGYRPVVFNSSKAALDHFRQHSMDFELILTDYMMPEMRGDVLTHEIHKIRPGIPVIMATGYSNNLTRDAALELGITQVIMKPVLAEELLKNVKQCLDGTRA
ncbi:MAG: hypothetical protein RL095_2677 [Verrucomicrobiota bacterium]|jgi:PAS domain S-box-containing protein